MYMIKHFFTKKKIIMILNFYNKLLQIKDEKYQINKQHIIRKKVILCIKVTRTTWGKARNASDGK